MLLKNNLLILLAAVFILVLGFVFGSMYTKIQFLESKGQTTSTQTAAAPNAPTAPAAAPKSATVNVKVVSDDPIKGNPNAKLTVVEFGDFQCPFCGRFWKDTLPQLQKEYIDTGKIKFVFKNLAFLGKESTDAANAALCAKEQNKYWQYHDKLYGSQSGENQGTFSPTNLKKFAADLGLNTNQFDACLDNQKYNNQVQADIAEANKNGFNSTPSVAVGTTAVIGAQPYAQFKSAVDAELSKAK